MSRFVDRAATDEITLSDGDRVWVRQRLTATEQAQLRRNLMKFVMNAATGRIEATEADWHMANINLVRAYIVNWSFADEGGQVRPVTPDAVDDLDEETIDELSTAINALQKERAARAEKKGKKR